MPVAFLSLRKQCALVIDLLLCSHQLRCSLPPLSPPSAALRLRRRRCLLLQHCVWDTVSQSEAKFAAVANMSGSIVFCFHCDKECPDTGADKCQCGSDDTNGRQCGRRDACLSVPPLAARIQFF